MSGTNDTIDDSVKRIRVHGEEVERHNPNDVCDKADRTAATKAMQHPSRGLMVTKLRFPRANN